jgi:hypothetical protein
VFCFVPSGDRNGLVSLLEAISARLRFSAMTTLVLWKVTYEV